MPRISSRSPSLSISLWRVPFLDAPRGAREKSAAARVLSVYEWYVDLICATTEAIIPKRQSALIYPEHVFCYPRYETRPRGVFSASPAAGDPRIYGWDFPWARCQTSSPARGFYLIIDLLGTASYAGRGIFNVDFKFRDSPNAATPDFVYTCHVLCETCFTRISWDKMREIVGCCGLNTWSFEVERCF